MKTNRIAVTVLAGFAVVFSSCVKEQFEQPTTVFSKDEVAFRIGSVSTKAGTGSHTIDVAQVPLKNGGSLYLQDEVTSLDAPVAPQTKGTPAFTENVKALYNTFNVVAFKNTGESAFAQQDVAFTPMETGENIWHYDYHEDIWNGKLPTWFFMRMPGTPAGVVTPESGGPYVYYREAGGEIAAGSIGFQYVSPKSEKGLTDAAAQQDILFTSHKREEAVNGEEITFYHALTGVKFANFFNNDTSNPNNKTETIIRSVTISGLKNSGTCLVTPSKGVSGKSAAAVTWSELDGNVSFTQTYGEAFAKYGSTYALDSKLNGTASQHNLNDADGTLTFWFIPQTLTTDTKVKVTFDIRVNGEITFKDQELDVSLGDALYKTTVDEETGAETTVYDHRTWQAGELHTFTLRPEKVGVKIEDKMQSATIKSDVKFTNTGNVDEYVRVYIIGNWVGNRVLYHDENNKPVLGPETVLMGYKAATGNDEVARWNDKDFTYNEDMSEKSFTDWTSPISQQGIDYEPFGDFLGLPEVGSKTGPGRSYKSDGVDMKWVRHDKFYYYPDLIGPGLDLPTTYPLFTTYTINTVPEFWIADNTGVRRQAQNVHLVMDIAVQAIPVPYDEAGKAVPYAKAWADALGVTEEKLNDL